MRPAFTTAAVTAIAAVLTATLAVPAGAAPTGAIGQRDCTPKDGVARLAGYDAFVDSATAQDTADGFHQVRGGQTLTVALTGTLEEQVNGGKARFGLSQQGAEGPAAHEVDLAGVFTDRAGNAVTFPASAGPFTWYLRSKIPAEMPPGHYGMALNTLNEADRAILCFQTVFQVA